MPTILHIDDNRDNRVLMARVLGARANLELIDAATAYQGLELAEAHRPALILLDRRLPDLHGDYVLAALKAHPELHSIPVIVLSSDWTGAQSWRLRDAGARECLSKPLDFPQFLLLLDEILPDAA